MVEPYKTLRLGIVGSRRRSSPQDKQIIRTFVEGLLKKDLLLVLVSGGCKEGADKFAADLADEFSILIMEFLPDESLLPSNPTYLDRVAMYYARNKQIAENSDALLALAAPDRKGGTENTIKEMYILNKKVLIK